jgi:DNA-binding CsgD family transcriptional regulator
MTAVLSSSTVDIHAAHRAAVRGVDRERAVEIAADCADYADLWDATSILLHADEPALALACCERVERRTPRHGAVFTLLRTRITAANGGFRAAHPMARAVLDEPVLSNRMRHFATAELARALVGAGQLDAAAEVLRPDVPDTDEAPYLLAARAALHVAAGRPRQGFDDYLECGRRLTEQGVPNPAVLPWRSRAAHAALVEHRRDLAAALAEEELVHARRWGTPRAMGVALHAVALTRDHEEQVELLGEAVDLLRLSNGRAELVHASRDLRHVYRAGRRGAAALTRQEAKIAWLARAGYTNPQISEQLFLTRRTVEFHLSGAYRKLGISGRADLRRALPDRFLDP